MICDLNNINNINDIIKSESLDVLVISYGGCCTNTFVDVLEQNGYNCRTQIWDKILCHCPQYIECDIPIIYIYDNPIKSFLSMKNREGHYYINQQKMSNNVNIELSDENLLRLMIGQFNSWTSVKKNNVLIIKSSELFEYDIINKLSLFLHKELKYFPMKYITPKTNANYILNNKLLELFTKYKDEIDRINNFVPL